MNENANYSLGIDIGSTTVKIAILDQDNNLVFSDYERHYANIQETLALLLDKARKQLGSIELSPMITGSKCHLYRKLWQYLLLLKIMHHKLM